MERIYKETWNLEKVEDLLTLRNKENIPEHCSRSGRGRLIKKYSDCNSETLHNRSFGKFRKLLIVFWSNLPPTGTNEFELPWLSWCSLEKLALVVIVMFMLVLEELPPLLLDMVPFLVILTPHTVQLFHVLVLMISAVADLAIVGGGVAHFHRLILAHHLVVVAIWHVYVRKALLGSVVEEIVHPHSEEVQSPAGVVAKVGFDLMASVIVSIKLLAIQIHHFVTVVFCFCCSEEKENGEDCALHLCWGCC